MSLEVRLYFVKIWWMLITPSFFALFTWAIHTTIVKNTGELSFFVVLITTLVIFASGKACIDMSDKAENKIIEKYAKNKDK